MIAKVGKRSRRLCLSSQMRRLAGRGESGKTRWRSAHRRKGRSMRSRVSGVSLAVVAIVLATAPVASGQETPMLEEYTVEGSEDQIAEAVGGVELAGVQRTQSGI